MRNEVVRAVSKATQHIFLMRKSGFKLRSNGIQYDAFIETNLLT